MTESQVARSAMAERGHVFRECCLVVVAVAEEAAAATRNTHTHTHTHTHNTHTPSLPGREKAQRTRFEEGARARRDMQPGTRSRERRGER